MECIILAFKVVFPILIYVTIGYILKCIKLYDEKGIKAVNDLVFKLFLPFMLFYSIYTTNVEEILNPRLIAYVITSILILFVILMITIPRFIKDNSKCGVFIQGVFRSNFALLGMPVTISLMGEENSGLTSLAIAFVVPLYNILAVICLERFRKNNVNIKNILKGIVKNPLIIASLTGTIFLIMKIHIPELINNVIRDLSRVATPLALIGLGSSFTFVSVRGNLKKLIAILGLKLIIVPAVAISIGAYIFGFKDASIVTMISLFASPTAVSSFTMAQSMGGDSDLAAQTVVFTSIFSIITIFIVVAFTKYLGLF